MATGDSALQQTTPGLRHVSFTEKEAWRAVGSGWRPLHGSWREQGYSVEWHDFETEKDLDWSPSFHPGSVEICLNVMGRGKVRAGIRHLDLAPLTAGFYLQGRSQLKGTRKGGERHQFVTIEFSPGFLARHVAPEENGMHRGLQGWLRGKPTAAVSEASRLTSEHREWIRVLQDPPVQVAPARRIWAQAKALEMASSVFFPNGPGEELFCQRQKRVNRERVQKVVAVLKLNLAEPPSLEEIGRRVGCSQFYLSRIFSEEMGQGIFQHLRELRMDRAAALLREGRLNVTQIALEVGYASPSHFSTAFHQVFGCCPGLYPIKTPAQRAARTSMG
jgi:AraC-like DNA-binding protein